MKRKILLTFLLLSSIVAIAQSNFDAFKWGQELVEQERAKQWDNPISTFGVGCEALATGSTSKAFKYLKRSAELGNANAMAYLGNMYELGIEVSSNCQTAELWYMKGANKNNISCKNNLNRISDYGCREATEENRQTYLSNVKKLWYTTASMAQKITNSMDWGGSSSSSSLYTSCKYCGGTGKCSRCGGSKGSWEYVDQYTGSGATSFISCSSCGGSGRCSMCHGSGRY